MHIKVVQYYLGCIYATLQMITLDYVSTYLYMSCSYHRCLSCFMRDALRKIWTFVNLLIHLSLFLLQAWYRCEVYMEILKIIYAAFYQSLKIGIYRNGTKFRTFISWQVYGDCITTVMTTGLQNRAQ